MDESTITELESIIESTSTVDDLRKLTDMLEHYMYAADTRRIAAMRKRAGRTEEAAHLEELAQKRLQEARKLLE